MDSESMGYAYVYPLDGSPRQEYLISMSPENMANFIGKQGYDAEKIIIPWCYRNGYCTRQP